MRIAFSNPGIRQATVLAGLLAFAACRAQPDTGVYANQFLDVATPARMTLRPAPASYSDEVAEANYRRGHFEYVGRRPDIESVCDEIVDDLVHREWDLELNTTEGTDRVLRFTRGQEEAVYRVRRSQGVTEMIVDVRPHTD